MIKLAKEVDYAVSLLYGLKQAEKVNPLSLREFTTSSNLPYLFLQKIARKLKKAEIIDAIPGSKGGYYLRKKLDDITLHDLYQALDRLDHTVSCLIDESNCKKSDSCTAKAFMAHLDVKFYEMIGSITLTDYEKSITK